MPNFTSQSSRVESGIFTDPPYRERPHRHQRRDAHPGVVGVALPAAFCITLG